jgi:large subunit ribosomal protein L31
VKANIHPRYEETTVVCACGNSFQTRSTKESLRVDVCSNCHPFFTGEQRLVDTAGQVDRFMRRLQTAQAKQADAGQRRGAPAPAPKRSLYQEVFGDEENTSS